MFTPLSNVHFSKTLPPRLQRSAAEYKEAALAYSTAATLTTNEAWKSRLQDYSRACTAFAENRSHAMLHNKAHDLGEGGSLNWLD